MDGKELLEYLQDLRREWNFEKLLDAKGYSDLNDEAFGLNPWTQRLFARSSPKPGEYNTNTVHKPDHFVSFLSVPSIGKEELIDTNEKKIRTWLSNYNWKPIPSLQPPFTPEKIRACSEGLLLPRWIHGSNEELLENFLLLRRDGVFEFGLGREAYSDYEDFTVFQLIHKVGRLWQYLVFVNDLSQDFFPESPNESLYIINIRGTENTLMGNLAEGWKQPIPPNLYNSYCPKCLEKHIQIRRRVSYKDIDSDVEMIVRWFAIRIENCWGQDEPRCYVHPNYDESQSFAQI